MSYLTTAEIATIQADIEATLPDTCTISHKGTPTKDTSGRMVAGSATAYTSIPCRVAPQGGRMAITAEQLQQGLPLSLTLPYGQPIDIDDTVTHGTHTYKVVSVSIGESEAGCVRAMMELER